MRRSRAIDITGQRFGKLVVIKRAGKSGEKARWLCHCDCGRELEVEGSSLRTGNTKSCGCQRAESNRRYEKGETKTRLYHIWNLMRQRCNNPKATGYELYGGRGISVSEEWNDYLAFKKWALSSGYSDGSSLDRINNDLGYGPDNCRWATAVQQNRNTRQNHFVDWNGEHITIAELSERTGIAYHTLKCRIYAGWPAERLAEPVRGRN